MKVGVVGTGHVGLPTAATLAHVGHEVMATDADGDKIELLHRGGMPFFESGLEELVRAGVEKGRLRFTADPPGALREAQVAFLCVGTPPRASGEANLIAVEQSADLVGRYATGPTVVVEKSTVPAGTAARISEILARHRSDGKLSVVCNPEFLREGSAVEDSLRPDRILVGSDSQDALAVMRELYAPLVGEGTLWIETDLHTAELAKHASNAFLALKVSFANALARIAEAAGADVDAITEVMGADPRIGKAHLSAGLGYGGSCFPKDLLAFERLTSRLGYDFPLLREIARINEEAVDAAFRKVEEILWNLEEKRVALLGLAFKPGTDDVRYAPALGLADRLLAAGADVVGYDPQAGPNAKAELPGLEVADDPYIALTGADAAVVCTEWDEIIGLDLVRVREIMKLPIMVDGRNVFDSVKMGEHGFTYLPTGRPQVRP
ncbi:MAG: UDP-glucose dehydrogenase family protein [Actinomycetota bacterium]